MAYETITVGASSRSKGIPYRIRPHEGPEDPENGKLWFFEYQLMPDPFWRPRGTCYEKDGKFIYRGVEYGSAYEALAARVERGR